MRGNPLSATRRVFCSGYRVSALGQFTVTVIGNADAPLPVSIKKRWPSRVGCTGCFWR